MIIPYPRPSLRWGKIILAVTYAVGVGGLSLATTRGLFIWLTPVHLLLTAWLFFDRFPAGKGRLWVAGALVYVLGWTAEAVGVHTGMLFGVYAYGKTLGLAYLGIPLIIGLNWLLLVAAGYGTLQWLRIPRRVLPLLTALLITAMDWLIEPVAIRLDMWHWYGATPPLQNYVAWALLGWALAYIWHSARPTRNALAIWVIVCQAGFFALLHLLLLR